MAGKEGFDTDEKKSVGLQGLADAIKGVFNKSKETFLLKEENLSDIDDRQVALNNITEASTDNAGKILYVNDEGNAVLVDRYEKAGGVQTNELHTHDCRYNGKAESFQPIMKFILLNNQEKFSIEFCVQSCDNVGGPVYNSRYCYQHSTSQSKFNCVYSEYSEEAKITDVIAIYSSGTVTFYKRRRNQYDYFINIVYATSTNGYFISSSSKPIYYVGNVGSAALKEYEQKVESADFIDVADTSSYPENAILPAILQSDWEETDEDSLAYIKNKPEITSTTPDWNASEGESGYIENRTHYIYNDGGEAISFIQNDFELDWNDDLGYYQLSDTAWSYIDQGSGVPTNTSTVSMTAGYTNEEGTYTELCSGNYIPFTDSEIGDDYWCIGYKMSEMWDVEQWFQIRYVKTCGAEGDYQVIIAFNDKQGQVYGDSLEFSVNCQFWENLYKKLDSNFIDIDNETITINDEGKLQASGGSSSVSDWNENDETSSSYIKNRTHYVEESSAEPTTVLTDSYNFTYSSSSVFQLTETIGYQVDDNTIASICWNGGELNDYTGFVDEMGSTYVAYGSPWSERSTTGWWEVCISKVANVDGKYNVYAFYQDGGDWEIGVTKIFGLNVLLKSGGAIHQLDNKFIAIDNETITVNDEGKLQASGTSVTPDWNSSSEEDGYIKNRICYSEFEDNSDYADVENIEPGSYAFGLQLKDGCYYDVYINDTLYSNVLCYSYEDGGTTYFDIDIETIIEDGNYYWEYVEGTSDGTFTFIDDYGKYGDNIEFLAIQGKDEYVMKAIDDKYINIEEYTDDELTSLWTGNEIDNAEIDG